MMRERHQETCGSLAKCTGLALFRRRPQEISVTIKLYAVGVTWLHPCLNKACNFGGERGALDHNRQLGVEVDRARIQIKGTDQNGATVEHGGLGVKAAVDLPLSQVHSLLMNPAEGCISESSTPQRNNPLRYLA